MGKFVVVDKECSGSISGICVGNKGKELVIRGSASSVEHSSSCRDYVSGIGDGISSDFMI